MAVRVLMRGGIYILFIVAAAAGWLLKRRLRSNSSQTQPIAADNPIEPGKALQHPRWQIRLEAVRQMGQQAQQLTFRVSSPCSTTPTAVYSMPP